MATTIRAAARYAPYLPRLIRTWSAGAAPFQELDATLVSVDLSGFTAL